MASMIYLPDVVTLKLDVERCTGCRMCTEVCPHGVFVVEERKARIVSRDACMECGACMNNCAFGAISVKPGVGCATALLMARFRKDGKVCC